MNCYNFIYMYYYNLFLKLIFSIGVKIFFFLYFRLVNIFDIFCYRILIGVIWFE